MNLCDTRDTHTCMCIIYLCDSICNDRRGTVRDFVDSLFGDFSLLLHLWS